METFSALLAFVVTGEFPSQRPVTRSFDVFFGLGRTSGWVNNRNAGDLRCHRAYYDATVVHLHTLKVKDISDVQCMPFAIK